MITAFRKLSHNDGQFESSLGYTASPCLQATPNPNQRAQQQHEKKALTRLGQWLRGGRACCSHVRSEIRITRPQTSWLARLALILMQPPHVNVGLSHVCHIHASTHTRARVQRKTCCHHYHQNKNASVQSPAAIGAWFPLDIV